MNEQTAATVGRRLAWLLRRDVPLEEALARVAPFAQDVREKVGAGATLAQAFEGSAFPRQFIAGLAAGGEEPARALEETARRLDESRALRADLDAALLYPRCLTLGLMVLSLSLYFWCNAVPSGRASWEGVFSNPLSAVVALAFLVGLLALLSSAPALDALRLRMPVLGEWLRRREAASLLVWLEPALAAGMPLPEALRWAGQSSASPAYAASVRAAADELARGTPASVALAGCLPPVTLWLVARAEQQGFPPGHLSRAATFLARQLRLAARRGLEVLTPALIVLAGVTLFLIFRVGLYPLLQQMGSL